VRDRITPAALIVAVLSILAGCGLSPDGAYPVPLEKEGLIRVDISAMSSGSCRFFTYPSRSGRNVNYMVCKDSAGKARVSLDACRTCYRWRKGYRLEGEEVACAKCDTRFPINGLAEGTGSCVPMKVPAVVEGGTLVISASDLEEGARYF
jgi:uncharacterized membrane protein